MKVLITGITGLIGSATASLLRDRGDEVVGVSRQAKAGVVQWDPARGDLDVVKLEGFDAVVHLAGETIAGRWTRAKKRRILESRTGSTDLISRSIASLRHKPSVLVSGSGIGFYGECGPDEIDETAPKGSGFLADVCESWEEATRPATDAGIRTVHARTGLVLAAGGGALRPLAWATKMFVGGPLGSGTQMWSWISLADEARAIVHLIDSDVCGPVNLTAPSPSTQIDIVRELAEQMGRPARVRAPRLALETVLGEMSTELIFQSCAARPTVLMQSGFRFEHRDLPTAVAAALS